MCAYLEDRFFDIFALILNALSMMVNLAPLVDSSANNNVGHYSLFAKRLTVVVGQFLRGEDFL